MRVFLLSMLTVLPLAVAQQRLLEPTDLPLRQEVAAALTATLAEATDLPSTVALAAIAGTRLPSGSAARGQLDTALRGANLSVGGKQALRALRGELGDLAATLAFAPVQQAELPKGFPGFQAVDELELRHYPVYRMVRTGMKGGSNGAFWPLFRHIESNGIAMTTPVQMDWGKPAGQSAERPLLMAFLYGDPTITPQHTADGVEVVEVPALTVLSIGAIGDDRRDRVDELHARLLAFVAAHQDTWQVAGALRTMGYNSPMVSRDRRYFEVQLPVRPVETVGTAVIR